MRICPAGAPSLAVRALSLLGLDQGTWRRFLESRTSENDSDLSER